MVTREGLEPPTFWFVAKRSNPTELPGRVVVDKEYITTGVFLCQTFFEIFLVFFGNRQTLEMSTAANENGGHNFIMYIGLSVISGIFR